MATTGFKIACLKEAARNLPEYAGIVPLFINLYQYIETAGRETGISFSASRAQEQEHRVSGFPLLAHDDLTVDSADCTTFLKGVINVLLCSGRDGSSDLENIGLALDSETIPLQALFRSILERKRAVIDDTATAIGVPSPLLEYVLEIPFKTALEQFSTGCDPELSSGWQEGNCPVCGSRAGMAELSGEEGKRFLCCSACSFRWPYKRLQCPFCGNEDSDKLSYFVAGDGPTRVDTCTACSRYIKTRDSRQDDGDMPLEIEDLLTIHLDLLASREGFERGK
jgi:FdhE protein